MPDRSVELGKAWTCEPGNLEHSRMDLALARMPGCARETAAGGKRWRA
jgi:hypothetical protein